MLCQMMAKPPPLFALRLLRRGALGRLLFGLIEVDRRADQGFERRLVDRVALDKIDRAARVAGVIRIEQPGRIRQIGAVHEGEFDLGLVGIADGDDAVARPYRAAHPFPFLDDRRIGGKDGLADPGQRLAAPVICPGNQLIDLL